MQRAVARPRDNDRALREALCIGVKQLSHIHAQTLGKAHETIIGQRDFPAFHFGDCRHRQIGAVRQVLKRPTTCFADLPDTLTQIRL